MIKIIEVISEEEILEECKITKIKNLGGYRGSLRNNNFARGRSRSKERQFQTLEAIIEVVVDQDQVLE